MAAKYWLAGNPNAEITNAEVTELATISETDLGVVSDLTVSANEINKSTAVYTASTALSADGTLVVNTLYHVTDTGASTYAMPATATIGDKVKLVWSVAVASTNLQKIGVADVLFDASSNVFKQADEVLWAFVTKPNGSSNDFLNITGATNGACGIGSWLEFTYNGSKWHVEGYIYNKGDASGAANVAFGDT
jgi:hypothetical protein